jgi:hypothetical protein
MVRSGEVEGDLGRRLERRVATITRQVTVTFTGGPRDGTTVERTVTIEFNGTQFPTLTVNGQTFEFDLPNRGHPHGGP